MKCGKNETFLIIFFLLHRKKAPILPKIGAYSVCKQAVPISVSKENQPMPDRVKRDSHDSLLPDTCTRNSHSSKRKAVLDTGYSFGMYLCQYNAVFIELFKTI